ncbi:TPA_asm: M [Betula betacytorhabdovirus 1]|nr:TPA_asm: M [Betula betacytorhabdovirus 1]
MSFRITSIPVTKLSFNYGVCVGNLKITIEGDQKDIIQEKWMGMVKITALQHAKEQSMSVEDSTTIAEFLYWYLREVSNLYPPLFVENDDITFGPDSYMCKYESPTHKIFKCKERLNKDMSINFKADNIIQSSEGVMISRVTLQGLLSLGPLTEVKATEIFHRDKNLMLVGTFINSGKSTKLDSSQDVKSDKQKKTH